MIAATVVVVAAAAGLLAWLASGHRRSASAISVVGLGAISALALGPEVLAGLRTLPSLDPAAIDLAARLLPPEGSVSFAEARLVDTPFARLWLAAGAGSMALLHAVAMASGDDDASRVAPLVGVAGAAAALALDVPHVALVAAAALAFVGAVTVRSALPASGLPALRAAAATVALATVAAVVAAAAPRLDAALGVGAGGPGAAAPVALVAMSVAWSVRAGLVPFQRPVLWAARASSAADVPLQSAWLPFTFGLVTLGWVSTGAVDAAYGLADLRFGVAIAGSVTVVLAGVAMLIQADLGRLVAAGAIQDGGLVLLALGAGGDTDGALRSWLLVAALARTATGALVVAVAAGAGSRRIDGIDGWIRRAPLLAVGLALALIGGYGWPGSIASDARRLVIERAVEGPLATVVLIASIGSVLAFARLLWVGLRPSPGRRHDASGAALLGDPVPERERRPAVRRSGRSVAARRTVGSLLVVALAGLSAVVSLGGTILAEAAAGPSALGR